MYTKLLKKDKKPSDFNIFNIESEYQNINSEGYDALIVINGNVNYFGGIDNPSDTLCYYIINHFNGPVFYMLCDPHILLTQIWKSIEKKEWASKYKKEDIEITRDDIVYISQPRNTKLLKSIVDKKTGIKIKDIIHFPFENFVYLTSDYKENHFNYEYDLMYGGTFRSGRRQQDMIKFYFGYPDDIKVKMFGKIKKDDFKKNKYNLRYPEFGKSVSYDNFNDEMSKSLSTVIISDPLYKELDDIAQRVHEGILTGNIVFIDESADRNKIVFGKNPVLSKFSYVKNREDVEKRIRMLNNFGFDYIKRIINLQRMLTKIDKIEYSNKLKEILERYV